MDSKLLIAAALTAALTFSASPVAAQHMAGRGFSHSNSPGSAGRPGIAHGFTRCHEANRRDTAFGCGTYGESWAYADGDWALYNNRSWEPESYNDWWHDRPDRAFPRWVQEQRARGTCDPDREWWSGAGWHC